MCLTKSQLAQRWQVTDLGEPSKIIGIEITRGHNTIFISQKKYIEHLLCKEGMEYANPVVTLLDHAIPILLNPNQNEDNQFNPFARVLDKLQYIANAMQLNISFAINRLVSHTTNPSMQHYNIIKRILRYLSETKDYRIIYHKWNCSKQLIIYANAAHANADEKKSTTGIVFLFRGGVILWKSKC